MSKLVNCIEFILFYFTYVLNVIINSKTINLLLYINTYLPSYYYIQIIKICLYALFFTLENCKYDLLL